jgi:hypothetical protein
MLKFIYTETGLNLELLTADLEDWVEQRIVFAIGTSEKMFVSSQKAAFLLPETSCDPICVSLHLHREGVRTVTVNRCDVDSIEIGLKGYWLSTDLDSVEGVFITQLPDRVESYLWQLWCRANSQSVASDGVIG